MILSPKRQMFYFLFLPYVESDLGHFSIAKKIISTVKRMGAKETLFITDSAFKNIFSCISHAYSYIVL